MFSGAVFFRTRCIQGVKDKPHKVLHMINLEMFAVNCLAENSVYQ